MSTSQRAVMLCDWRVKADMVLFAGNTVWSISERIRGVCVDALYKLTFTLLLTYLTVDLQESTAAQIITYFEGGQADLVVCDGAPDGQMSII